MSNELTPFKVNNLPVVANDVMDQVESVSEEGGFLPRIQLITKGKYVDTGKISPGHWGVPQAGGEEIEDLGVEIDIIPFAARAKALDVSDRDAIIAVYEINDPEFQRIKNAPKNSGCMWGPSFLVLERNTGKLYELFFGNKSGRAEAGRMRPFLPTEASNGVPSPCTLKIRYKKGKEWGWHVPVVVKCSEMFDPANCPSNEVILEEIEKFTHPESGVQKVEESDTPERAR